jgi:hypothetical protein
VTQDVVSLLFPGDSQALLPRYAQGAQSWQAAGGAQPESIVAAHTEDGLLVTLVWAEGHDHHEFGSHMLTLVRAEELPRPRVTHGLLITNSWDHLTSDVSA